MYERPQPHAWHTGGPHNMLVPVHKFCPERCSSEFCASHFAVLSAMPATALWKEGERLPLLVGYRVSLCCVHAWEEPTPLLKSRESAVERASTPQGVSCPGKLPSIRALCFFQGNLEILRREHPSPAARREGMGPGCRAVTKPNACLSSLGPFGESCPVLPTT